MKRFSWRPVLWVIVLAALGLFFMAGSALADKGIVPPELERAIQEKGLSWTPRAYDRDFALGLLFLPEEQMAPQKEAKGKPKLSQLAAIDWRNNGGNFISPVKDQEDCGSCWAFSSVAALESGIAMAEDTPGTFLNLSEQILVSCESNSDGCNGGYIYYASVFLQNQGTAVESCFPYCACDASCSNACANWQSSARRISGFTEINQSVNSLRAALANGPVVAGFYVCSDFPDYGGGVYEYAWGVQEGGHAVLIVGYTDTPGQYGGGYFIVKNSWGTGWGESGYFRIGYSQVTNSMVQFGVENYQYQVSGGGGGGEVCNASRTLACGGSDDRNNGGSGSTDQIDSYPCAVYNESGPEYAYRFVPTASGDVEVSLTNLTDDLDLFVLDGGGGECAPTNCIAAGTNGGSTDSVTFNAVAGHTYYLVVDGYSGAVSNYHIAVSCCSHPATPSLTAPANGGTTNDNTPTFRWGAAAGADSYQIQVDDNADFSSPLVVDTEVTTTSYTPASGWGTGTYYWRVRGHNTSCGIYGNWSSTWSVTVVIGGALSFDAPTRWLAAFGYSAGGWTSQNLYPRAVGDVNGDGLADVVGFANDGVYVSLSTGGGLGAASRWLAQFGTTQGWTNQDTYPRCIGDVNGDGKADVVGFATDGVYVSLSTSTGFAASSRWIARYGVTYGWTSQNLYPRLLGDVNNDGRDDVVGFYRDGVYVSLSTGTSFGASVRWIVGFGTTAGGWASQDKYPRCVADVNGDGRTDVVGFGNSGAYVSLSTGTAFGASSRWIAAFGYNAGSWKSQNQHPRCVADVNGDGRADVVGFGNAGAYVSFSTGTSFGVSQLGVANYGYSAGGWTSQDKYPRTLGDVNGDGRADIVGFGNAGVYISLSQY